MSATGGSGPFDVELVDRAYTQWQFGDWSGLADIDEPALTDHPDRARVALMVAAAHQQLGRWAQARHYAGLARRWGCGERALARWLLSGVHNTLGRAAATLGRTPRAVGHFQAALETVAPPAVARLALPVRLNTQFAQLGMEVPGDEAPRLSGSAVATLPGSGARALEQLRGAATQLAQRHDEMLQLNRKLTDEIGKLRKQLSTTLRREIGNMALQIEAHADVQRWLDHDTLTPPLHGWAVSADYARHLVFLLTTHQYDAVIEFGSGSSTALMATAVQRARLAGRAAPRLLTLEHHGQYHAATALLLQRQGVSDACTLVHAELREWRVPDGSLRPFYDADAALATLAAGWRPASRHGSAADATPDSADAPCPSVLAVVDGPPEATGPQARYPALPMLLSHFPRMQLDLLLDDYRRADEHEIVARWMDELHAAGWTAELSELDFEKKAAFIRARPATCA